MWIADEYDQYRRSHGDHEREEEQVPRERQQEQDTRIHGDTGNGHRHGRLAPRPVNIWHQPMDVDYAPPRHSYDNGPRYMPVGGDGAGEQDGPGGSAHAREVMQRELCLARFTARADAQAWSSAESGAVQKLLCVAQPLLPRHPRPRCETTELTPSEAGPSRLSTRVRSPRLRPERSWAKSARRPRLAPNSCGISSRTTSPPSA